MKKAVKFVLDDFCMRQFDKAKAGLSLIDYDKAAFAAKIQESYDNTPDMVLHDGYAPFCKHIFVPNFTTALPTFMKITPENEQFIRSGYEARRENELAVLVRWFDVSNMPKDSLQPATFLDIILYSKE